MKTSLVDTEFRGNDLLFKTDEEGNPISMLSGREIEYSIRRLEPEMAEQLLDDWKEKYPEK